jgi:tetratricopeptide (TPR) repeat protein
VRSNPRLLSRIAAAAAMAAVATTLVLGLWGWSEARVGAARVGAEAFRDEFHAVRDALNAYGADAAEAEGAVQRGQEALARYSVLQSVDWADRPDLRLLPPEERERLRREAGELLLMLANASARPRSTRPGQSAGNEEALDEARRLNGRAETCFPEGHAPPALWLQRAELLNRRKRLEEGPLRQELEAEEAEARRKAQAARPETAEEYYQLAREHAASGRSREAVPLLEEAVRRDPRHFWAHFQLGFCQYELGDNARAVTSYSVCVVLDPQRPEAYFNRGLAAHRQRDYAQAKSDFDAVIRLKPDQTDAYANRGLVLQAMQKHGDALADFDRALQLGETTTRLYFLRARARELAGDAEGAKKDRAEGLRREPVDELSWVARGNARLRTDPEGALADYDRALAINPRSRVALMGKADVLAEQLGRTEASIAVLDRVLELYPDHTPAWGGRGVLHARRKDRDAALRDAAEAMKRLPTPLVRYQVACVHALAARTPEEQVAAVRLVMEAMKLGFGGDLLARDTDLDPIRSLPEFKRLEQIVALQAAASR